MTGRRVSSGSPWADTGARPISPPLGINDWRSWTIVPDAVTEDICDPINRGALSFSIKLFLAFVMSAMLISFIIFRTRQVLQWC